MRLGLYGGSFDPVHLGHLLVAQAALEELALDRLVFIPAARSPFKPDVAPASGTVRARMLRLALAGEPRFSVDELELHRGGISYTIETARAFQQRFAEAELCWLIGADHVPALPRWRDAEALARLLTFVVIPRPGEPPATLDTPWRLVQLRGWPLGVSSSEIRTRVSRGENIRHLVPPAVAEVIAGEGLYAARAGTCRQPAG